LALNAATGGQDVNTTGTEPIIPSAAGTLAAGTTGVAFTALEANWSDIVTNLVIKNLIANLRKEAVFAQAGNAALKATHVPGTNQFVYTAFGDLPAAVDLLEGVPPVSVKPTFANFAFGGKQKGNVVAITDLAAVFSPFDLYTQASEKLAWNAVEAIEDSILAAINAGADALTLSATGFAAGIIETVTQMKRREVPMFGDRTYHAFAAPETLAKIMSETGELGWTDAAKYASPDAIMNGEMGRFRGIRFMETTRLDGSTDKVIVFGPEAWAQGDYQTIRPYRVTGADHADPLEQRALFGWKGMWGHKVVELDADLAGAPADNKKLVKVYTATLVPTAP
jgi:N4-gp56 family major capsid protein